MKKRMLIAISVVALTALFVMRVAPPSHSALAAGSDDGSGKQINPPPFDFADFFYQENGIDLNVLNSPESERFGRFRRIGPHGEINWKMEDTNTSPIHNNIRILQTVGAYKDDDGSPNQFFSIIAFAKSDKFFGTIEARNNEPPNDPDRADDEHHLATGRAQNARGITMEEIVGVPNALCPPGVMCQTKPPLPSCNPGAPFDPKNCSSAFEAYAGLKQRVNGVIAPAPCGTLGDGLTPCFPVTSIETSHLRQDWRLTTNRARVDNSASFAYFGDNLLGMWVITYHWFTKFGVGGRPDQPTPTANCQAVMAVAARQNGVNLDGTPIIHNGEELHFFEGVASTKQFGLDPVTCKPGETLCMPPTTAACATEGNLDPTGADGGAVWLVCPAISDPTHGAIADDAFLDVVRRPDGQPLDPRIARNFACLQQKGEFCKANHGPDPDGDGDHDGN